MNEKWQKEKKAIKATQVAFDISSEAQIIIKKEALSNSLNPPDQIRKILGLPYNKKPQRPRLTVTLKEEDFVLLAEKYGLDSVDHAAIKEKVSEELLAFSMSVEKD
ncbi:MAG: hypothetical protein MI867_04720 [Pseudomonadales bacterium]|nr:hypothetical protein [Pseudomonadales bacterium]